MFLNSYYFSFYGLYKCAFCCLAVYVPQKGPYVRVQRIAVALAVQEYLRSLVAQLQPFGFNAPISKCIHRQSCIEGIKGTNKYDIRRSELIIHFAFFQHIHIYHSLIIARPFRQSAVLLISTLHFNVKYPSCIVFNIHIQAYALAVQPDINRLFRIGIGNIGYLNLQYFLNQILTQALIAHNLLK